MVKAVLFGSLSSLTNLVDLERRAFNRTFKRFGIATQWSGADYDKLLRTTGRFSGPTMAIKVLDDVVLPAFFQDLETQFRDLVDSTRLAPHPWTDAALDVLVKRTTKVALVSGAERQTVLRVLAAIFSHRASTTFDVVTAKETAAEPKPSPQLYNAALEQLRVDAENVFAIEATHHGVLAAKRAGIRTARFRNPYTSAKQMSQADFELGRDLRSTIDRFHASNLKRSLSAKAKSVSRFAKLSAKPA